MKYRKIKKEDIRVGLKFFIDMKDEETGEIEYCPCVIERQAIEWVCRDLQDNSPWFLSENVLLALYCED